MKLIILFLLLNISTNAQTFNSNKIDTIEIRQEDILYTKDGELLSNVSLKKWHFETYQLNYFREIATIKNYKTFKKGIYDLKQQKLILPINYDYLYSSRDSAIGLENNKQDGLFFIYDNKIIEPQFKKARYFENEGIYLLLKNDTLMVYNKAHILLNVISNISDFYFDNNLFYIIQNEKKGIINTLGQITIKPEYVSIKKLQNGNFILDKTSGNYIYDSSGKRRLTKKPFYSYTLSGMYIIAIESVNNKILFYNYQGKLLATIKGELEVIPINSEGFRFFKYNDLYGIVAQNGKIIKQPFLEKKSIIPQNYKYFKGFINNKWNYYTYAGDLCNDEIKDYPLESTPPPPGARPSEK